MIAGAATVYGLMDKNIAKNGSPWAYGFAAINIGLYLSILGSLLVTGIYAIATHAKKT